MLNKNKKLILTLCFFSFFSFRLFAGSCPVTPPYDSPEYCTTFEAIARCYCMGSGLPAKICENVRLVYSRMMATFGTLDRACKFQKNSSYNQCMDSWQCYLNGGKTSDGVLCNGTGLPCP